MLSLPGGGPGEGDQGVGEGDQGVGEGDQGVGEESWMLRLYHSVG